MKKRIIAIGVLVVILSGLLVGCKEEEKDNMVLSEQLTDNVTDNTIDNKKDDADVELGEEQVELFAGVHAALKMDKTDEGETVEDQETSSQSVVESESEYANLAIADVTDYVNVRNTPSTEGTIVGKIFDGAVAQILEIAGETGDWFKITSGNVEGYIKSEFFLYGDAAAAVIDEYIIYYIQVKADRLNVRADASVESSRIGYIDNGEKAKLLENLGDWLKVAYTEEKTGYVSAQYVTILEEFRYAKTLEEERAEIEAKKALEERQNVTEEAAPEIIGNIEFPANNYTSNAELRQAMVNYAMQFVGNRYVHGGSSLSSGTDCSGFTCFVYSDFGYSISRTPGGQYSGAGKSIDYSSIQPGDIICYSSNGGRSCTHVGLYIGNGQIVHAANSRKGVITSAADYEPIIGIKNVLD